MPIISVQCRARKNTCRLCLYRAVPKNPGPWIQDSVSRTLDPGPLIQDPGPWIQDPESRTLDPGFWILDPRSRTLDPGPWIQDPGIQDPGSWIEGPGFRILGPESRIPCRAGNSVPCRAAGIFRAGYCGPCRKIKKNTCRAVPWTSLNT